MPLPTAPATETTWLAALTSYLTTETGITWTHSPVAVSGAANGSPVGSVRVAYDAAPTRVQMFGDNTRDQILVVYWQHRGDRTTGAATQSNWKAYLIDTFRDLQRYGIPSGDSQGAFRGITPYVSVQQNGVFCWAEDDAKIAEPNANAIVTYTLRLLYSYSLPALKDC